MATSSAWQGPLIIPILFSGMLKRFIKNSAGISFVSGIMPFIAETTILSLKLSWSNDSNTESKNAAGAPAPAGGAMPAPMAAPAPVGGAAPAAGEAPAPGAV